MSSNAKKSQAVIIGADSENNFDVAPFDSFRQGINIRNLSDLIELSLGKKLRCNSSFRITIDGSDISSKFYNDQLAPSAAARGLWGFELDRRISERLIHEIEERDLGQLDVSSTPSPWQREDIITAQDPVEVIEANQGSARPHYAEELIHKTRAEDQDGRIDIFNTRSSIVLQDTDPRITSWSGAGKTYDGRTVSVEHGHGAYELCRLRNPYVGFHPFRDSNVLPKRDLTPKLMPMTDNSVRTIDLLGQEDGIPITVESMQRANRERAIVDNAREWDIMGKTGHVRFADESVDSVAYGSMLRR